MPFRLVLSGGHVGSSALLTRISRKSGDRENLHKPSPESDTLTVTDTSPPSARAALPSVSQGQPLLLRPGEPVFGAVPYCVCATAAEKSSSSEKRAWFSMAPV